MPENSVCFHPGRQAGLSLIEVMVAVTLGLLIMAALTTIFINNNQTRQEIERTSRQIENGRYAMQLLTDNLRSAGFYGEYAPPSVMPNTFVSEPDPSETSVVDIASLTAPAFLLHVQGYDDGKSVPAGVTALLTDLKADTDILVIRRASTCVAGSANCDEVVDGVPYFQVSLCNPPVAGGTVAEGAELASVDAQCPLCSAYFGLDATLANLNRHQRDCKTLAALRRFHTHIYFIANNDLAGDGIPTLKRAELGFDGFTIVPLVEGIENMQLEYGIDTGGTGAPGIFTADPAKHDPKDLPLCAVENAVCNWWNVMAVKVHLLARNTEPSIGYTDKKTYTLGLKADGTDHTVGPIGDGYRRHAYESVVQITNPAVRRQ